MLIKIFILVVNILIGHVLAESNLSGSFRGFLKYINDEKSTIFFVLKQDGVGITGKALIANELYL